jgi:hypothetical protein
VTAFARGEFINAWSWVDDPEKLQTDGDEKDTGTLTSAGESHAPLPQNGSTSGHAVDGGEEVVEQIDGDADSRPKRKKNKKRV